MEESGSLFSPPEPKQADPQDRGRAGGPKSSFSPWGLMTYWRWEGVLFKSRVPGSPVLVKGRRALLALPRMHRWFQGDKQHSC